MADRMFGSEARRQQLRDLLANYLCGVGYPRWPGGDGQTLHEVLCSYTQAASAGLVPNQQQLSVEHPELADELRAFFAEPDDAAAGKGG